MADFQLKNRSVCGEQVICVSKSLNKRCLTQAFGNGPLVIGGLGFMEEYDLYLYFKRAKAAEQMFGDADFHREMVAKEMGL